MKKSDELNDSDLKRGYTDETCKEEKESFMHEYQEQEDERNAGGFVKRKNQYERI